MQTTAFDPENEISGKMTNPFASTPSADDTQKKLFIAGALISILIAVLK